MSKKNGYSFRSEGGPDLTSAGVPWNEVPEFARRHLGWIDGRHASGQSPLPPVHVVPVPDILSSVPYLHDDRPVDRKPSSMPQVRRRGCGTWGPVLGSSLYRLEVGEVAERGRRLATGGR